MQCGPFQEYKTCLDKLTLVKNHASHMKLGSYDNARYTEHNGITVVMISQILM